MRVAISALGMTISIFALSACQDASDTAAPVPGSAQAVTATSAPTGTAGAQAPSARSEPGTVVPPSTADHSTPGTTARSTARQTSTSGDPTSCTRITRDFAHQILVNSGITPKIVLDEPQCVQSWAMVWSQHTDAAPQPTGYLLHPSVQGFWNLVAQGSSIDCGHYLVPAEVAAQLKGCRG